MTLDEYFKGQDESRKLFESLQSMIDSIGISKIRMTKSQFAFRRRKAFAWAWMPGKYLRGKSAPLVLTVSLDHKNPSTRWKQVVQPYPGRYTHHLELYFAEDIDKEVHDRLLATWTTAARFQI